METERGSIPPLFLGLEENMAVKIESVASKSVADILGIRANDKLLSVNGQEIRDVLDYGFYTADRNLTLIVERESGEKETLFATKKEYEDLGLEFTDFLMDSEHSCDNHCIFCFVDQLPEGMRETLYFKDDDERLSYLFGNYLTLTNLSDREVSRMIEMHITPVNISVHTTNEALRCKMLGNRKGGESLRHLFRLAKAKIEINCQIVLCRGINDGDELERTMEDLEALYPSVGSVAIVPVGLTKYREKLFSLEGYDKESAGEVLDRIERRQDAFRKTHETGMFYPADEWFLLAERPIPELSYYDELMQLENGVGMLALLKAEFLDAIERAEPSGFRPVDLITGEASADWIASLLDAAKKRFSGLKAEPHVVKNEFFGGNVVISGLLTGEDIKTQVRPEDLKGETLLIPRDMLRSEGDLFLDGLSLDDLSVYYNREVIPLSDGYELFEAMQRDD